MTTRTPLRKRLTELDLSGEHAVYRELGASGATDFLAMPLEYGDGSVQGSSFSTTAPGGCTQAHIEALTEARFALTAALEPIAIRKSQESLLTTYLGVGAAREVGQGNIKRGEYRTVSAAILFADLRGFTEKSATWPEPQLLEMMGDYFEMVVDPIRAHDGDILKFMGDGILAIFPTETDAGRACQSAIDAARQALADLVATTSAGLLPGGTLSEVDLSAGTGGR